MSHHRAPIIETEWVYTGPVFALNHPLAQQLGPVWLIVVWCAAYAGLCGRLVWLGGGALLQGGNHPAITLLLVLLALLLLVIAVFAVLTLIGRHPAAWYPAWVVLVMSFPLSLPLVIYFADGVRPNLIYRHRFERLATSQAGGRG